MSYTTIAFLGFVLITGILYYVLPKKIQWVILLIASLVFFVLTSGWKTILMIAATAIIYVAGILLSRANDKFEFQKKDLEKEQRKALKAKTAQKKKAIVVIAVLLTLGILLAAKYSNFFGSVVNSVAALFGATAIVPMFKLFMPLGISYYTLMSISYIVDVYRGVISAEKNPFKLLLFVCYFPHIVEGPFDRYKDLSQQLSTPHTFEYDAVKNGGIRMIWGFFKKFVIADRAAIAVNAIFAASGDFGGSAILLSVILYTFQIYAEFSGCMDIVSGISEMFGVKIAQNFARPFFSGSINEFWRRWHITLGLWLKEYVFYPVSISKHFKNLNKWVRAHVKSEHLVSFLPAAYSLFFVWFCNGMWHGASGKYVFYGLYYYVLMMLGQLMKPVSDKALNGLHIKRETKGYHLFEILRTDVIVCLGMLIFRAPTLSQAGTMLKTVFINPNFTQLFNGTLNFEGIGPWDYVVLAAGAAVLLLVSILEERGHDIRADIDKAPIPARWAVYLCLIFSIVIFGIYGGDYANPSFIYGDF